MNVFSFFSSKLSVHIFPVPNFPSPSWWAIGLFVRILEATNDRLRKRAQRICLATETDAPYEELVCSQSPLFQLYKELSAGDVDSVAVDVDLEHAAKKADREGDSLRRRRGSSALADVGSASSEKPLFMELLFIRCFEFVENQSVHRSDTGATSERHRGDIGVTPECYRTVASE